MDDRDITFEDTAPKQGASYPDRLAAANGSMLFMDIKGKSYAQVNQRILAFWSLFPEGRIETEKISDDGARCDFRAMVYRRQGDERPAATGHAYEYVSSNHKSVNATSYVENCETSAVGRALGMLGIGATTSIASADEVLAAMEQQAAMERGSRREPPEDGPFAARCQSCGKAYTFRDRGQYEAFLADPQCCPSPAWEVV